MNAKPITLEEAKNLKHGTILFMLHTRNSNGEVIRWRVNGKVKLWKRSPKKVHVPIKHGLYVHAYLHERNLDLFTLMDPDINWNWNGVIK